MAERNALPFLVIELLMLEIKFKINLTYKGLEGLGPFFEQQCI